MTQDLLFMKDLQYITEFKKNPMLIAQRIANKLNKYCFITRKEITFQRPNGIYNIGKCTITRMIKMLVDYIKLSLEQYPDAEQFFFMTKENFTKKYVKQLMNLLTHDNYFTNKRTILPV